MAKARDEIADKYPFDPKKVPDPNFKPPKSSTRPPELSGFTEAVEGWRAWALDVKLPPFGNSPKLLSVAYQNYYWTPRRVAQAFCSHPHTPPGEHCGCGFYTARTLEHLLSLGYARNDYATQYRVLGKVACWGEWLECTTGWRSQFAYPVQLWLPFDAHKLRKPLMEAYGVPVRLANFQKLSAEDIDLGEGK